MSKSHKVLLISAPIGSGHIRAAQAVSAAIQQQQPDATTKIVDVFDFFNPFLGQTILKIYLKILDVCPQLYGNMYDWGNDSPMALAGRELISRYLAERMYKYILDFKPTTIVCTHATPAGLVACLSKKNKLNIPSFAVVTDFVGHRLWVYPELSGYFVANENTRKFLSTHGIPLEKSQVVGIPVDEKFTTDYENKREILTKLQLRENEKTILVMGGGAGVFPMDQIVQSFETIDTYLQIIVVTGNNSNMFNKLQKLQPALRNKIKIFKYVPNIHELMAVSDILISKPGGMTSAEALCMGLPMIIYRPIPGQEEANTRHLLKYGAACCADSIDDIRTIVTDVFISQPDSLASLKQNTKLLCQPTAASSIAIHIISQNSS